ncbi:MAG: hypothetical protein HGA80_08945 [Candidatus Omnitrophica bacterium]|nr:hypothetical protein [Candidatus Omnitrophota bacterium]
MSLRNKWVRSLVCLVSVIFISSLVTVGPVFAEVTLDELLARVEKLEQANAKLEQENASLKTAVASLQDKQSTQETKLASVQSAPAAAPATVPSGNVLKTRGEVELYGFVKADLVVSSRDMANSGVSITQCNASRTTATGGDDPETQMSAQDTRLGLKLKAPDLDDGGKLSGQFEMDFGNSGANLSGNYTPRMRLAFVQVDFDKWAVNAGQNWDFFAPLNSNLLNPGALYRAGNLGTRHPQANLTNKWGELLGGKVLTKVGVIDTDDSLVEDTGMPVAAAYASYERKILGVKSTFGVGGMYGRINLPKNGTSRDPIYATTAGLTLQFTDWLAFKGEGFSGVALNKFQGGPAQTVGGSSSATSYVPTANSKAIPVKGGFVELTYNPIKKVEMNVGAGLDNVNEDMAAFTAYDNTTVWSYNKTYYTNLKYSLSKDLIVGLEFQRFQTKWLDKAQSSDNRVETSLIYKF